MTVYRFDQIAENIRVPIMPSVTEFDRYVGLEHLDPESLKLRRWGSPSDVIGQKLCFWKGDIIYGKRRAYQRKLAVADFDGICSAHAMVLRAKQDVILPELLPFFLQSEIFHQRAMEISVGSLSPTINWSSLAKQEFPLPPLDEQRRISNLLWAADEAIETKKESIDNLLAVKKSAIAEKMRLKQSLQNELPNGWEIQQMGKYLPAGSIKNGLYKPNSAYGSGTKIIRIDSFQNGEAIDIEMLKHMKATKDEIETFSVYQDDILVNRVNSMSHLGKTTIVPELSESTLFESNMMCLRLNPDNALLPRYAWYLISSDEGRKQLVSRAKKAIAQASVNQEDVKSLTFPIPTISIQKEILDLIASVENTISLALENLDKTIALQHEFRESLIRL